MGFHGGRHRRLAPTKHLLARLRLRHDDGGAEATAAPSAEGADDPVVSSAPTSPRAGRAGGLGALVRDGLSKLLAVNF